MNSNKLIRGNVKVEWVNLGEGNDGNYDKNDPDDVNLLRFDVSKRENKRSPWEEVDDASYCTQVPASATPKQKRELLETLMSNFYNPVTAGHSVKKMGERLSWICLDDL